MIAGFVGVGNLVFDNLVDLDFGCLFFCSVVVS